MREFLLSPPHIFFVWMFCLTILFILGLLFWMLRDSEMAEPATMLVIGLVAVSILLGVEIMRYKAEKSEEINVGTSAEDARVKTFTREELNRFHNDLEVVLEILEQLQETWKTIEENDEKSTESKDSR